jgi:hypothetical protein
MSDAEMPHHRILGDPNGDQSLELSSVVRIHVAEALPDERKRRRDPRAR